MLYQSMPEDTREKTTETQSVYQLVSGTAFHLLIPNISEKLLCNYVIIISEKLFNFTNFHKIQTVLHLLPDIQR